MGCPPVFFSFLKQPRGPSFPIGCVRKHGTHFLPKTAFSSQVAVARRRAAGVYRCRHKAFPGLVLGADDPSGRPKVLGPHASCPLLALARRSVLSRRRRGRTPEKVSRLQSEGVSEQEEQSSGALWGFVDRYPADVSCARPRPDRVLFARPGSSGLHRLRFLPPLPTSLTQPNSPDRLRKP